ncbi:hypothetical protein G9A89_008147 [Geosiphon pyriformis]|nr:hypothetical protein G9A89_008147 [Geosiphon pyriformis]
MSGLIWKFATCNVWGINVPAKQTDIVRWHVSSGNMVFFIAKTKLRSSFGLWIKNKFDGVRIFTSGLDISYFGVGIAVIINNSLARHVSRVEEVSGKLLVTILGLYAGASPGTKFAQASAVNSLIAKAVNSSTFVVLGGNFNKNDSRKSASFKFCLGLSLEVEKTIDFILVSKTLSSAVAKHCVNSVSDFFDMNHKSVMVLVGLGGLLDFRIKDTDGAGWFRFKECSSAKMLKVKGKFFGAAAGLDLDAMWSLLKKVVVNSVNEIFSRHWFCDFQCSKNKHSSKFLSLELLVAKIVKCLTSVDTSGFNQFVKKWSALDAGKALILVDMVHGGQKVKDLLSYLSLVRKEYRKSKMFKSKLLQEATIRKAIEKRMEQFCLDKGSMIKSVVLDYLVVNDELILEPEEIRSSVDKIMEGWTQKCVMPTYAPLNYVRDDAFSNVMSTISMGELLLVTYSFLNSKAAGLSGIPNELWKHGCGEVLECLLVLLNVYLSVGMVPAFCKRTWDEILINTRLIALIETARKILSKILSDYISLACSTSTQSPVFAVGSVVEDALEKNREIWLVLQDMWKAYNSVVKKHEHLCEYCVDSKFVAKTGRVEGVGEIMSYLAAGAFVNNTIWIENCQVSTQYTLNIASEFFEINNISINNNKTVAISINQDVRVVSLSICGQPISIVKKGEAYHYLGIFLSTESLFKPSVSKAHSDVCFFVNVVLRKAITDKQFSYLVLAVLQPIVSYQTQFSFVSSDVCHKWDVMVRKSFKSKAGLPHDFPDAVLHHPSLYGLKTFEQVQSEEKIAALVSFFNASGVLGHLFNHRFLDLQVFGWAPLNSLQFFVKLCVSPVNNFLAGIVKIFLSNKLSLANNLPNAFRSLDHFPLSSILGSSKYFNSVRSLKHFGVAFERPCARLEDLLLLEEIELMGFHAMLVLGRGFSASSSAGFAQSVDINILNSDVFSLVKDGLHDIWSSCFEVYTDGSLRNAGLVNVACGAAAYFLVLDKNVGVVVGGLLSSILAELQAVVLALECVSFSCQVILHIYSQAAIDVYLLELSCAMPDFRNRYWLERHHIFNLVREKDFEVVWVKVKSHFGVSGNIKTDLAVGEAAQSPFSLLIRVHKHYLVADNTAISGNVYYFAGPGVGVVPVDLIGCVDWISTAKIWHLDFYMLAEFTGQKTSNLCSYLIKAKRLYDKSYSGILCLLCGKVEFSDHAFTCSQDVVIHDEILVEASVCWVLVADLCDSLSSAVLQMLSACSLDVSLYSIVCKGFVLNEWCEEAQGVFNDKKQAIGEIVNFVKFVTDLHHVRVWLVRSEHRMQIEKTGLVADSGVVSGLSHDVFFILSDRIVRMLGVVDSFAISFGCHLPCCFFSGLDGVVSVIIGV